MPSILASAAQARGHPTVGIGRLKSIAHRVGHLLRRVWQAYWRYRTRRDAALMLQALDDLGWR